MNTICLYYDHKVNNIYEKFNLKTNIKNLYNNNRQIIQILILSTFYIGFNYIYNR